MSAEGMPQTEPSLLSRPLAAVARLAIRFPFLTIVAGLLAAAWAMGIAHDQLKFHTNRDDVLNPSAEYNRHWLQYTKEFGDEEDVFVAIEGPDREAVVSAMDDVAAAVAADPAHFHDVMHKVDLSKLRAKGLHYLDPGDVAQINSFLVQLDPVLRGDWSQLTLAGMAGRLAAMSNMAGAPPAAVEMARQAQARWWASLKTALVQPGAYQSPWPSMASAPAGMDDLCANACRYNLLNGGKIGIVQLRFVRGARETENFAQNSGPVDALRTLVAAAKERHPAVTIGLTGLPVMENDEMRLSESAMMTVTFLSLGGIFLVLVAGFGNFRHSILATAAVVLGTMWTIGYTTVMVGYLNILSIAFGSILMGLGINYGIYFVARYLQLCATSDSTAEAVVKTAASVGPSITMGAFTAAAAFFTAAFTDFRGVAQLGVIAGGGILLCWLAAMTVLPALIAMFDARHFARKTPTPLDIYPGLRLLYLKPRLTLLLIVAATAALATGVKHLWYDDNLLNLQATGLESVQLERKLLTETNQSSWFALSVADGPADVLRRKAEFTKLPSVERVEELASLFPGHEEQNQPIIQQIYRRLAGLPPQTPNLPPLAPAQAGQLLAGLGQAASAGGQGAAAAAMAAIVRQLSPQELAQRLSQFQQRAAADLLQRLRLLRAAADPNSPTLADLPESLVHRFVGRSGKFLMRIYAKDDIWDLASRERFVGDIRRVDKDVTGNPIQVYEASRDMKRSYQWAALYALVVIVAMLFVEFGNLHYPLLAMLPLGLGVLQLFGLMGWLGIPLNSANMIVLPLILGLGAENGIHIVNDFRRRPRRYHRMSAATTTAVIINSLTTMVGFAALMIASHQGLLSLGRVLTIGMSCCLMSALVLPNLLLLRPGGSEAAFDLEEEGAAVVPVRVGDLLKAFPPPPQFVAISRVPRNGPEDYELPTATRSLGR